MWAIIPTLTDTFLHESQNIGPTYYGSTGHLCEVLIWNRQIGKSTRFWKINIFTKTAVFVICVTKICTVNEEILKNVIISARNSKYTQITGHGDQNASSWQARVLFQHESFLFIHGVSALPRLVRHWLTELSLHVT